MRCHFGVHALIWTEDFGKKDLYLFQKARDLGFETFEILVVRPEKFPVLDTKKAASDAGMNLTTCAVLAADVNPISPDPLVRQKAFQYLCKVVDVNIALGSKILGGPIYAAWAYLTGKPRTKDEWKWSVDTLRKVAEYAKKQGQLMLAFEPLNRFETHFLNIAEDAVMYCKDIGLDNVKVHLDSFHMMREETSFTEPVKTCGKGYLGYVHVCENTRGIPGTGLVPWREFFKALNDIGYNGPFTIESFDPDFEEINRNCAIWRRFAPSGEVLAREGLKNLRAIASGI